MANTKDSLVQLKGKSSGIIQWVDEHWDNHIRALAQLVPFGIGAAIDTSLDIEIMKYREERVRTLFDELNRGKIQLTDELIHSENFLHSYFATVKAALNTRRRKKIRMFARLLNTAASTDMLSNIEGVDEYEELCSILDELSLREMMVLFALEKYEERHYREGKFDTSGNKSADQGYFGEVVKEIFGEEIPDNELSGIVTRLNRTGCYALHGWRKGPAHDCRLTDIYHRLKELIQEEDGNLIKLQGE